MKKLIQPYYDTIRPYLPRRKGTYRGYVARDDRLLDTTTKRPNYKQGLVEAIKEYAPGRAVCIIGFGRGISSIIALEAGASSVTAYEASGEMIGIGYEAFDLNRVSTGNLTVRHALVGEDIDVYGSLDGADVISPGELDPEDVLVLDCEGAEISILERLAERPPVVLVETHPGKGAPTDDTRELLESLRYDVQTKMYERASQAKKVLVGTL